MRSNGIVVGVDGSGSSDAALRWATAEAARRRIELFVVHAYEWRVFGAPTPVGGGYAAEVQRIAETLVDEAVAQVRRTAPIVDVKGEAVLGAPAAILVEASVDAALIVVGSRGRGGFASLLLGSVSHQVASHAHGPVVVVRGDDADGPVVVGVDGSDGSIVALGAACEQAQRLGRGVVAIRVYHPAVPMWGVAVTPYVEDEEERRAAEREVLLADVAPWREKYPEITIQCLVSVGRPVEVLSGTQPKAGLIVVGTRGHGEFAGLVLGSVGLGLLQHAHSPVLVARPRQKAA